jgi:ubiquinone/menaquinone biosynthesis C-methylase UbiE
MNANEADREFEGCAHEVLPVSRTKREAKTFYDGISHVYDHLTGSGERRFAERALDRLLIKEGESALEIGPGAGRCLELITRGVGQNGKAHGIDISIGMLDVARRRLRMGRLYSGAHLCCGDAVHLPYRDRSIDVAFMSFTLELFDTPEIPQVLHEVSRVLKRGGRLGVLGMSRRSGGALRGLYEWLHRRLPKYVDCRPIYVEESLSDAGYQTESVERGKIFGLPLEIVIASGTETEGGSRTLSPDGAAVDGHR